jgi:hypothetical protein
MTKQDLLEAVGHGEDAHTDDAVGQSNNGAVHLANRSIKLNFMSVEHRLCIP